jgi:hypothetical protein
MIGIILFLINITLCFLAGKTAFDATQGRSKCFRVMAVLGANLGAIIAQWIIGFILGLLAPGIFG